MPLFIVTQLVDAFVPYTMEVEAPDAEAAIKKAQASKGAWARPEMGDVRQFDHREYEAAAKQE